MSTLTPAQPQLLSQINERSVLRLLQSNGPCSRAEMTRRIGTTAPTVSKAVASLLRSGLLEEFDAAESGRGRPARRLRLATRTAQVLALVIDAGTCRIVSASLDGTVHTTSGITFRTPRTYDELLRRVCDYAVALSDRDGVRTLGMGISMPGLIDSRTQKGLLSPNLPITDGHSPGIDLANRLGIETILVHECKGQCLAERHFGDAAETDNFVIIDATVGLGLGAVSGGRLQVGSGGYAGEIGHIPVVPDGLVCGCGRRGCLETVASDSAFSRLLSLRLGRPCSVQDIVEPARAGEIDVSSELAAVLPYLATAATMAINLFNPERLYVCSELFDLGDHVLTRLIEQTEFRALRPSFTGCRISRARGSKCEGAVAAIIEHLTESRVQGGDPFP
jgi:predicted NBD/HSP70 family sugar kinase